MSCTITSVYVCCIRVTGPFAVDILQFDIGNSKYMYNWNIIYFDAYIHKKGIILMLPIV